MKKKRLKYIFFISFIVGIVLANIFGKERLAEFGIFHTYFLQQYEYARIDETDLFLYIIRQRLPVFGFLVLFGMTEFWYPMHVLFVVWNGGTLGFLFVSALSNLGIKGILFMVLSLLPQYVCYVLLYLMVLEIQTQMHSGKMGNGTNGRGKPVGRSVLLAGIVLLLFVFGILTESYINPHIMKNVLKIF